MNLSARWLSVGIRVWTFTCAAVLGGLFALTLVGTGCMAGVAWLLPPTWHETQRSPGYVLNGRFQGAWVLERDSQPPKPGWERLELHVTEDLALFDDPHPGQFTFPRGVVARGELVTGEGRPLAFELTGAPGWPALNLAGAPEGLNRLEVWIEARDPGRLDRLTLHAANRRRSTYRRDVWFLPSP